MNKKILMTAFAALLSMSSFAQTDETPAVPNLDLEEDTANVSSLKEIIKIQETVSMRNHRRNSINSVWKRRKTFSINWIESKFDGKELLLGVKPGETSGPEGEYNGFPVNHQFKSDWGANLKSSSTIRLHKSPIANTVAFGLEFSGFDLSVNHFKKEEDMRYNSAAYKQEQKANSFGSSSYSKYYYQPWGQEMYEFSYALSIGPSITIAPLSTVNNSALSNIRLQAYYTFGYRFSLLWLQDDEDMDVAKNNNNDDYYDDNPISNSSLFNWGHGMVTTFGLRLNWKNIGVTYEMVKGKNKYKSFETKVFGSRKTEFSTSTNRIGITFLW